MTDSIVVTGLGTVTPLGARPEEILGRMDAGERAARPPTRFDAAPFSCPVCAEIGGFDAAPYIAEPKTLRLMNTDAVYAVAAAGLALRDAGLRAGREYPADEIALYGATGLAGIPFHEVAPLVKYSAGADGAFDARRFAAVALKRVRPVLSFKILSNMPISFVSIFAGIQGPNAVYNPWEGQGAQAIAAGLGAVARGQAACALVGGCDVKTHELAFLALEQQGVLGPWRSGASGPVPAEGAVFIVLEREDRARARGASLYARVAGHRLATRPSNGEARDWRAAVLAPLLAGPLAARVSADDGDGPPGDGACAEKVLRPKAHVGNLFAAAAALQVALAAAVARQAGPGRRVLAECFGHGSEQAAFLLEAV